MGFCGNICSGSQRGRAVRTCGHVWGHNARKCYWHVMARGQDSCPQARTVPYNEDHFCSKANRAPVEKHRTKNEKPLGVWGLSLNHFAVHQKLIQHCKSTRLQLKKKPYPGFDMCLHNSNIFKDKLRGLPGGPVVKTSPSNAGGAGSIPGRGAKIPRASRPQNQNKTEAILHQVQSRL